MIIKLEHCIELWEKIVFWLPVPAIILITISGIILFKNELKPNSNHTKKQRFLFNALGPLHPMATSQFINQKVVAWRWPFIISFIVLVTTTLFVLNYPVCKLNT